MIHDMQTETAPGFFTTDSHAGRKARERAVLKTWLCQAQQQPGDFALSTRGVRLLDPASVQTSAAVRNVMRVEVKRALANTISLHIGPGASGALLRVKNVMMAMAHDCVVYIDAFGIDNEDSLLALARACMDTVQTAHPGSGPAETARTEMVKIVWQAQSAARHSLRSCKAGTQSATTYRAIS